MIPYSQPIYKFSNGRYLLIYIRYAYTPNLNFRNRLFDKTAEINFSPYENDLKEINPNFMRNHPDPENHQYKDKN